MCLWGERTGSDTVQCLGDWALPRFALQVFFFLHFDICLCFLSLCQAAIFFQVYILSLYYETFIFCTPCSVSEIEHSLVLLCKYFSFYILIFVFVFFLCVKQLSFFKSYSKFILCNVYILDTVQCLGDWALPRFALQVCFYFPTSYYFSFCVMYLRF